MRRFAPAARSPRERPKRYNAPRMDDDEPKPADVRRPRFADAYPRDPELDALVAAFARGDYRTVRDEAPALAARSTDFAVQKAARDLRARLEPDPLAIRMLIGAAALLLFFTWWFYSHKH